MKVKIFTLHLFLFLGLVVSYSRAGFDTVQRWDHVIGMYDFETLRDLGPRSIDLLHVNEKTSLTQAGKIGYGLRIERFGQAGRVSSSYMEISEKGFAITAWVKIPPQETKNVTSFEQNQRIILLASAAESEQRYFGHIILSVHTNGSLMGSHYQFTHNDEESTYTTWELVIEDDQNDITDARWYHVAYVKPVRQRLYQLFIDGELVEEETLDEGYDLSFEGPKTVISIGTATDSLLDGIVYVDEVGFFERGFRVDEVKDLYDFGLEKFLDAMSVNPQEKVATTWAEIKAGR